MDEVAKLSAMFANMGAGLSTSLSTKAHSSPLIGHSGFRVKRIHAEGDAVTGFRLSFNRNYDLTAESRRYETLVVTKVRADLLIDTPGDEMNSVDAEPQDAVEKIAAKVPTPGPSLVSSTASVQRMRVEIRNCQTWLLEVVAALHKEGIVDSNAIEVIKTAPTN